MTTRKMINICSVGIILTLFAVYNLGPAQNARAAANSSANHYQIAFNFNAQAASTLTQTPTPGITETGTPTPISTDTPAAAETPLATSTETPTPTETTTSTPVSILIINGSVLASKPVTVTLLSGSTIIQSVNAGADGTFSLSAPAGSFTIIASAPGFLDAQGFVTISDPITTMPTTELIPGDLDDDDQINQLDLLTIGINYNKSSPTTADLNNDGVINVLDLQIISRNYLLAGPSGW